MPILDMPSVDSAVVFDACSTALDVSPRRRRIRNAREAVLASVALFQARSVTRDWWNYPIPRRLKVRKADFEYLYDAHLVREASVGRSWYDSIILLAKNGRCAACLVGVARTLDHYLPKADVPLLSICPLNLIPTCGDCNWAKSSTVPSDFESQFINPYYDELPTARWLSAVVKYSPNGNVSTHYSALATSDGLSKRAASQFSRLGYARLFGVNAANELESERHSLKKIFNSVGELGLRAHLRERAESRFAVDPNHWAGCAYQAWLDCSDFCLGRVG